MFQKYSKFKVKKDISRLETLIAQKISQSNTQQMGHYVQRSIPNYVCLCFEYLQFLW